MRSMKAYDAEMVVRWRNSERIQNTLEEKKKITIAEHLKWFETKKGRIDYVVEVDKPIGVWSFKMSSEFPGFCLEQGRYIGEEEYLGKGYAKEAVRAWTKFGFLVLQTDYIVGVHRKENIAPQKINEKYGFEKYYDGPEFVKYYMDRDMFESLDKTDWGVVEVALIGG